jgi:hypothetical protein
MKQALLCIGLIASPLAIAIPAGASPPASCAVTETVMETPPQDANADPFGPGPWYVNSDRSIWAGFTAAWMKAGGRGNKVMWIRPAGTTLIVAARQLDGASGRFEARIPCCYPTGFQASGLRFSEPGCWEVSARAGNSSLTFVTRVLAQ